MWVFPAGRLHATLGYLVLAFFFIYSPADGAKESTTFGYGGIAV